MPGQNPAQRRRVGLAKPCSISGGAIYFNYSGPLDGICGKCTDQLRRRLGARNAGSPTLVRREGAVGFGWGSLLLAFAAGAAAAVIALLSGWVQI
jgi:hypothetical protein